MGKISTVLRHDVPLEDKNTLHLNAVAKNFYKIHKFGELKMVHKFYRQLYKEDKQIKLLVIGEGSNIVLANQDINALVVCPALKGFYIERQNKDEVFVNCSAGEKWRDFVIKCCQNGWSGLENLAGIYGTVGAAPVQNIGAYGEQVGDWIYKLKTYNVKTGKYKVYTAEKCRFAYRSSVFKTKHPFEMITSVTFRLNKHFILNDSYAALAAKFRDVPDYQITPLNVAKAVTEIRNSKLPDVNVLGNAGSFFKNPLVSKERYEELKKKYPDISAFDDDKGVKISAGWLIEKCGFKGKRKGNVGMYEKQALVLVNYGGATYQEVLSYAEDVKKAVFDTFNIELEAEPKIIE